MLIHSISATQGANFNLRQVMDLQELLNVKAKLRDANWEIKFLEMISHSSVRVLSQDPQEGPDGFPYLLITTYGESHEEPFLKVAQWCADAGVGIVLNPTEEGEDYLFTFGMLWNFKYRGEFFSEWSHQSQAESSQKMVIRQMTELYWPDKPRKIFKEFLLQQNIFRPRVCLFSKTAQSDPELGISLDSVGSPPSHEHSGILEAFSWFFPRHYTLVFLQESQMGVEHFVSV